MSTIPADPQLSIDAALRELRSADAVEWESDFAATFRARLARAEGMVVAVGYRVANAQAALTRPAEVS